MTRVETISVYAPPNAAISLMTGNVREDFEPGPPPNYDWPWRNPWYAKANWVCGSPSATWGGPVAPEAPCREVATAVGVRPTLLVADLGWTTEEAVETRYRLLAFKEDWEAPGMEAYDAL